MPGNEFNFELGEVSFHGETRYCARPCDLKQGNWSGQSQDRSHIKSTTPFSIKGVRSFLGHAGFYRRFIKNFSNITRPLCNLLAKDVVFEFDAACIEAFTTLKKELTSAPIIMAPDWSLPFEIMCDASDFAIGAVLGQRKNKLPHVIYYASRTLNDVTTRQQRRSCLLWFLL